MAPRFALLSKRRSQHPESSLASRQLFIVSECHHLMSVVSPLRLASSLGSDYTAGHWFGMARGDFQAPASCRKRGSDGGEASGIPIPITGRVHA